MDGTTSWRPDKWSSHLRAVSGGALGGSEGVLALGVAALTLPARAREP